MLAAVEPAKALHLVILDACRHNPFRNRPFRNRIVQSGATESIGRGPARVEPNTKAEARVAIFQFIEGQYDPAQRNSALEYTSPINYERRVRQRLESVSL